MERKVVMIVEDDPAVRELMAEIIRDEGHEVVECDGAMSALATLDSISPDLITLDLAMPSMDGFQFLRLLRRQPRMAQVPVVVVTAAPEDLRSQLSIEAETVGKPFRLGQLIEAVERGLARRNAVC